MSTSRLKSRLQELLGPRTKVAVYPVAKNVVDIIAISPRFEGLSTGQRQQLLNEQFSSNPDQPEIRLGFTSLYTPSEAESLEITADSPLPIGERPMSWLELVDWGKTGKQVPPPDSPRTVAFYSFKGGLGRTTALAYVAWILSMRGKRVAVVDMDLEAPSLYGVFPELKQAPKHGLLDYLYERLNTVAAPTISVADIVAEVVVPKGSLFLIPAGQVDEDYIARIDDLRNLPVVDDQLWGLFKEELFRQLQPDVVLIDSRTGLNVWGALSVARVADQVVFFCHPSSRETESLKAVMSTLMDAGISVKVVLSPVPPGKAGAEQALNQWRHISELTDPYEPKSDGPVEDESGDETPEVLGIPYTQEIALSEKVPNETVVSLFYDVANLLDNESDRQRLSSILVGETRWPIIHSLKFPSVNAKDQGSEITRLFQKTADFDRFIEPTTVLIRGKKGTGKTHLYWTTLMSYEMVRKLAPGRLDNVIPVSGHGPYGSHPMRDDFLFLGANLTDGKWGWEAFWRVYALYRIANIRGLQKDTRFLPEEQQTMFRRLKSLKDEWTSDHTSLLLELSRSESLRIVARDLLKSLSHRLGRLGRVGWLLYDDMDLSIPEYTKTQSEALEGLFLFVLSLDEMNIDNVRPKVFLRTDIWHRLNFTNKSHFVGRDVELRWTRGDFLRLAYRQASLSSKFAELVSKYCPVPDPNSATEDALEKALEVLWGILRERSTKSKKVSRWVYERLTDASGSTFPRSLSILLQGARERELEYENKPGIPSPSDRLLRMQSLNEGLIAASEARCDELRQEHGGLDQKGFFSFLGSLNQITDLTPLRDWWKANVEDEYRTFEEFREQLTQIGLAAPYDDQRWKIADIYAHGFKMGRKGRM